MHTSSRGCSRATRACARTSPMRRPDDRPDRPTSLPRAGGGSVAWAPARGRSCSCSSRPGWRDLEPLGRSSSRSARYQRLAKAGHLPRSDGGRRGQRRALAAGARRVPARPPPPARVRRRHRPQRPRRGRLRGAGPAVVRAELALGPDPLVLGRDHAGLADALSSSPSTSARHSAHPRRSRRPRARRPPRCSPVRRPRSRRCTARPGQLLGGEPALAARLRALRGYPIVLNVVGVVVPGLPGGMAAARAAAARFGRRVAFVGVDALDTSTSGAILLADRQPRQLPQLRERRRPASDDRRDRPAHHDLHRRRRQHDIHPDRASTTRRARSTPTSATTRCSAGARSRRSPCRRVATQTRGPCRPPRPARERGA